MNKIFKKYQDRLNDISRRNRAIRLSRIIKKKTFDLSELKKIDKELPINIVENIINNKSVNLINTNVTTEDEQNLLKSINYLKRDVEFIFNEKGYYECFLGYPFIQGNFNEGSFFRCPLFLYPITIEINRNTQKIVLKPLKDSIPLINKTFFLAFNKYNKGFKKINLEDLEGIEEIERKDLLDWGLNLFKKLNLKINTDNFSKTKLSSLKPLTKDEHPTDLQGKIEILPLAIIGEFSQLNSAINKDYDNIISGDYLNSVSKMLMGNAEERDLEKRYDEEKLTNPPEIENFFLTRPDISQEHALLKSRTGKGLVIHGPPGTGKSQVITNLISDNLIRNKKILVVCEKRAALDVVANRLGAKNFNKYCLLVHDAQNDRNAIFQKMNSILEGYDHNENDYLENTAESVSDISRQFDDKIKELNSIIDLIHDPKDFNIPLYDLYRHSKKDSKIILNLNKEIFNKVKDDDLTKITSKFNKIANIACKFDQKSHPFYYRKPLDSEFDEINFKEKINELIDTLKILEKDFYQRDYKQDIKRLDKDINLDFLSKIYNDLQNYKQGKNKITRFLNRSWISLHFKYKELLKDQDFDKIFKRWSSIDKTLNKAIKQLDFLNQNFKEKFVKDIEKNIISFENNSKILKAILNSLKDLDNLIILDKTKQEMNDAEKEILSLCLEQIPFKPKENMGKIWGEIIKNSFYLKWINLLESKNIKLKDFSYKSYESIRRDLVNLLNEKLRLIPQVANNMFQKKYKELKWLDYDGDGRRRNYNNLKYLIHEINKKRRRISIRQLIEKFKKEGLFDLFPCWMCSPETVSSIFPLQKDLFDIVIFDEASQTKLEKAIPSIIRGKKLIVAGDEKQLPPTTFFLTNLDDDEDLEELDDEEQQLLEDESLLIRSKTILPGERLLYHYRSNHHELIDFSNYAFYDSRLRVLPRYSTSKEPPIKYIQTKGIWENKCNLIEAKEVVKLIKELLLKNKKNSTFGIITFNIKQKDIIQDLLEEEARKDPVFGKLYDNETKKYNEDQYIGLFVKNIENVQGDERDVIIFSVGYGFDNIGKFRYRFGPLNGIYGPNRLNVAISRAKEKVYTFSSFDPTDLKYEGKYEGPKLLREYLSYCKAVSNDSDQQNLILNSLNKVEITTNEFEEYDSDFEGEIRDELVKLKYKVKTQVGCKGYKIDLGILHPKKKNVFLAGIECDGAAYHSSKSAKDRDIYRQSVLEDNGWKILRIWSRDWWRNPEKEIKRIDRELKSII